MTLTPHPYPAYKPSAVPWLGDVPGHWETPRLKGYVTNAIDLTRAPIDGELYLALEHLESWTGRFSEAGNGVSFSGQVKRFHAEDVLFGKLRPYLAKVTCPKRDGVCVGEFLVLRPHDARLSPRYLEQLLRSKPMIDTIDSSTFGAKMPRADWQFIGDLLFPLPPLHEQQAIVKYLNHADRRIRHYVTAKQKLIALLEEEKQAVVSRAVTRGLDPNVRLKPSGVEWFGDVPEHWEVRRLRTLVEMRVSNVDKHTKEDEFPIRLCNYVDVYKNDLITQAMPFMSATASRDEIQRFRLERDDVLITKDSETWDDIGVPALVAEPADDLISGYHLALFRPYTVILGAYLARTLQSKAVAHQFHVRANGVTRYGLTHVGIQSVQIPLPPPPEQRAIVEYLDKTIADIEATIDLSQRQIELLQEYRTKLIADVVTGKLDVREAAAQLPDETDEEEPYNEIDVTEDTDDSSYDEAAAEAVS